MNAKKTIDLKLISGDFLYDDLPSDKEYLRKYFPSEIQNRFLVYYVNFRELKGSKLFFARSFVDHTGIYCDDKWVCKLIARIEHIEKAVSLAQKQFDLEKLAQLKCGTYKSNV